MLKLPQTPPRWIEFLGPPMGGLAAGLSGAKLEDFGFYQALNFWQGTGVILLIALPFAFLPIAIYRLWLRASKN